MKVFVIEAPYKTDTFKTAIEQTTRLPFRVLATRGHLFDLPSNHSGFDESGRPLFLPIDGKRIEALLEGVRDAREVIIATDPDREGEAIAYEVFCTVSRVIPRERIRRVHIHAISASEVDRALSSPRSDQAVDLNVVRAALVRRVIDRLIGYTYSQRAKKDLKRPVSVGRVKTAVLRYLATREFTPAYWVNCVIALGFDGVVWARGLSSGMDLNSKEGWGVVRQVNGLALSGRSTPLSTGRLLSQVALRSGVSGALKASQATQSLYQRGVLSYPRTRETVYDETGVEFARVRFPEPKYAPVRPDSGHEAIRPAAWIDADSLADETERLVYSLVRDSFEDVMTDQKRAYLDLVLQTTDDVFPALVWTDDPQALELLVGAALWIRLNPIHANHRAADLFTWMEQTHVGTPATYASTVEDLIRRDYLSPTSLTATPDGRQVAEWVSEEAPWLNADTSARLEECLVQVEQGKMNTTQTLEFISSTDPDETNRRTYETNARTDLATEFSRSVTQHTTRPIVQLGL